MSKIFQTSDSVYISVRHKTYTLSTNTWALADADSGYPKITIIDSAGTTKVTATSMTKKATGLYEYIYSLSGQVAGHWTGYIDTLNASYPDREHFSFEVE